MKNLLICTLLLLAVGCAGKTSKPATTTNARATGSVAAVTLPATPIDLPPKAAPIPGYDKVGASTRHHEVWSHSGRPPGKSGRTVYKGDGVQLIARTGNIETDWNSGAYGQKPVSGITITKGRSKTVTTTTGLKTTAVVRTATPEQLAEWETMAVEGRIARMERFRARGRTQPSEKELEVARRMATADDK